MGQSGLWLKDKGLARNETGLGQHGAGGEENAGRVLNRLFHINLESNIRDGPCWPVLYILHISEKKHSTLFI